MNASNSFIFPFSCKEPVYQGALSRLQTWHTTTRRMVWPLVASFSRGPGLGILAWLSCSAT